MDFHSYSRLLFRQQIQCAYIHITVNKNDVLRGFLYETCQEAEGIVNLPVKKYFLAGLCVGVNEVEYLLEFFIGFLLIGELLQFNSLDALEHMGVAGDESPHLHKRPHDTDADLYGYIAP